VSVKSPVCCRYIEGLTPESRGISDWEKTLTATPENTPLSNNGKLPIQWLANGVGHHDNAVSALWALRDLMLKDTLTVSRTLEFSQLWYADFANFTYLGNRAASQLRSPWDSPKLLLFRNSKEISPVTMVTLLVR